MRQIPPIARPPGANYAPKIDVSDQNIAKGEFRGMARWLGCANRSALSAGEISQGAGIDGSAEDPREAADGLDAQLAALADEIHRHAAAARDGVMADYAARAAHARKHLSPQLLAATLGLINEQRKAALALIERHTALELAGRRRVLDENSGGKARRPRGTGGKGNASQSRPKVS